MDFTPELYLCVFSICLLSHKSSCADPKYEACVPKSCGNFTISFPFYIQDQQESFCGYPGFNLTCNNNEFPTLHITDDEYVVDEILYDNHSLRLSNAAVWRSNSSCSLPQIRNITLQDTSFELISNNSYLVIFSNCSSSLSEGVSGYKVDCEVSNSQRRDGLVLAMYGNDKGLSSAIEACEVEVVAPVDQVYVESSTGNSNRFVDYVQLLRRGFLLSWTSRNCTQCEESGGKCGFEAETYLFKCYCPDRPHSRSCLPSSIKPNGLPADCSVIQLPLSNLDPTGKNTLLQSFKLLSAEFTLQFRVSSACRKCHSREGQCYKFDCTNAKEEGSVRLILETVIPVACVIVIALVLFCCFWTKFLFNSFIFPKERQKDNEDVEAFLKKYGPLAPTRYRYLDVKKMTNSFKPKLGQGGYGDVYKGKLLDGHDVAVKILNNSKGDGEDFLNEVVSISRTSHVNVVTLLGFCFEDSKRALIYEFMPNGSLDKFIPKENSSSVCQLGWETLYEIAHGIARGLEYLHRGCNTRILHFDIKPHNILLDDEFCPKISDFGLAKLCFGKESVVSMLGMRGTPGYIAPEVFSRNFGGVSHKSDVYSFGMMILEMVGGKNKINQGVEHSSEEYFPEWIYKRLELNDEIAVDGNKVENGSKRKMTIVGLWCIQTDPSNRPSMRRVLEMLEGRPESLQVPPRPFLVSVPEPLEESSTT